MPDSGEGKKLSQPRPRKPDGSKFSTGEQLCDTCANFDGCPLREELSRTRRLIRECAEYDSVEDIIGPVPSLDELLGRGVKL